jgi:hypothetical protein
MARARLVGHYSDYFGPTSEEYLPDSPVAGRPGFIVVEHAPSAGRPYWTYATAGLSLWEQASGGPDPRVEFLAYSPEANQTIVDVLMVLAREILLLEAKDTPYKTFDTVTLTGPGLAQERVVLAPPQESDDLLGFPDVAKRPKDARFTQAITEDLEARVPVAFLQVVPVLPDEMEFATTEGTPALIERMDLEVRGKGFGWGRKDDDSILR